MLGSEAISTFSERGFVLLPRLFALDEMAWVRDEARVLASRRGAAGRTPKAAPWGSEAPAGTIYGAHLGDGAFRRLAGHPRVLRAARQLLGDGIYVHQSRLVPHLAENPADGEWRRDFTTWRQIDGMWAPRALTAAVVFDELDGSSMLHVVPGSHDRDESGGGGAVAVAAPLGSVLFYHANLAYRINGAGDRKSPPLYLISYNVVGNPTSAVRGPMFAARDAEPPAEEADDCLQPPRRVATG